jgi:hypothetical protein
MNKRTEAQIDEIVAMCDGDLQGALKALMLVNEHLEFLLEQLQATAVRNEKAERSLHWVSLVRRAIGKRMENEKNLDRSNVHYIKRPKRLVSRTRLVMGLLLIVAIPIFVGLANKAVRENAEAIQQGFGR